MTAITKDQEAKRQAIRRASLQNFSQVISLTGQMFGSFAALAESQDKKNFKLSQGLRMGEAVMNTAAGVTRALAEYPWPYSVIVGAIVAASGAAQIATIASAKPPQAHGGASFIPRESTYLLDQGERVLSPNQNEDFTDFMKGGGGGGGNVIMIDGRKLGDELYAMSRDGRLRIDGRAVV